jgi:type 1 glutamine amidotransferase
VRPFAVSDEQYVMALTDPGSDVFLQSRSEHGSQPAGWTRREGRGRVCVLTPGHTADVWSNSEFQKLVINALKWMIK